METQILALYKQLEDAVGGQTRLILVAAVLLFVTWSAISTLRTYLRLRHIPGPSGAGLSTWWLARSSRGGRIHLDLYEAIEKYGPNAPFTRVGPNQVITSDPVFMKRMLNAHSPYEKSDWYQSMRFDPTRDNILSIRDNDRHTLYRAKLAPGYSGRDIDHLEPRVDRNMLDFVNLLDRGYISKNKTFDFGRKANFLTMDVISDVSLGQAFGFLRSDSDLYEYIALLESKMLYLCLTAVYPWIIDLMASPIFRGLLPSATDEHGFGKLIGIAKQAAATRFGPNPTVPAQNDMLGSFVAHGLNQADAESEVIVQVLAGSDTTATAIRATTLHIITNPRVCSALYSEIHSAGLTSRPWNSIIPDAEARNLPYLQAVIKEGLRIHPPAVGLVSKSVPASGDTYKGVYLPPGMKIGHCVWGVMRDKSVWGGNADEFRPERWLETKGDKLREMESTLELVFGLGRWQCLGRNVALMELNKVFVELLRRFELVVVKPGDPWKSRSSGLFVQRDFWVRGYRREAVGS